MTICLEMPISTVRGVFKEIKNNKSFIEKNGSVFYPGWEFAEHDFRVINSLNYN